MERIARFGCAALVTAVCGNAYARAVEVRLWAFENPDNKGAERLSLAFKPDWVKDFQGAVNGIVSSLNRFASVARFAAMVAGLGAVLVGHGIPLGPADCAEEDGIRGLAIGQGLFGQGCAICIDGAPAHQAFFVVKGMAGLRRDDVQDAHGFCDHFRADAITGEESNVEIHQDSWFALSEATSVFRGAQTKRTFN